MYKSRSSAVHGCTCERYALRTLYHTHTHTHTHSLSLSVYFLSLFRPCRRIFSLFLLYRSAVANLRTLLYTRNITPGLTLDISQASHSANRGHRQSPKNKFQLRHRAFLLHAFSRVFARLSPCLIVSFCRGFFKNLSQDKCEIV